MTKQLRKATMHRSRLKKKTPLTKDAHLKLEIAVKNNAISVKKRVF